MIDIKVLRAAGLTEAQILRVVEEDQAQEREQTRQRVRTHRGRKSADQIEMALENPQQNQQSCNSTGPMYRYTNVDSKKETAPSSRKVHARRNSRDINKKDTEISKQRSLYAHKTKLPSEWVPSEPDVAYAQKKNWTAERIDQEAERFRLHWHANGKMMANWHATWCKWVTSPYQNGNGRSSSPMQTVREKRQEGLENVKAALDSSLERERDQRESDRDDQVFAWPLSLGHGA